MDELLKEIAGRRTIVEIAEAMAVEPRLVRGWLESVAGRRPATPSNASLRRFLDACGATRADRHRAWVAAGVTMSDLRAPPIDRPMTLADEPGAQS